jgi:hypothetical protein
MTYNFDLASVLVFADLTTTLFVEVSRINFALELFDLYGLSADFLNLLLSAIFDDSHFG